MLVEGSFHFVNSLFEVGTRILVFSVLLSVVWAMYQTLYPCVDDKNHVCKRCSSKFKCRGKGGKRINTFQKRMVSIGNFPVEVADAKQPKTCCTTQVGSEAIHFCSFRCYIKTQRILRSKNSLNSNINKAK